MITVRSAGYAGAVLVVGAVQLDLGIGPVHLAGVVLLLAGGHGRAVRHRGAGVIGYLTALALFALCTACALWPPRRGPLATPAYLVG